MSIRSFLALGALVSSFVTLTAAHAAYMVVPFNRSIENFNRAARTHMIILSRGNDLGNMPQLSGFTAAQKLQDVYPNDQIVLFVPQEAPGQLSAIRQTQPSAYLVESKLDTKNRFPMLDAKRLFDELVTFEKIASIHTFGHGAIPEGVFLDRIPYSDRDIRWHPNSPQPPRLVGHFTEDAFVNLNNCNLGHSMASMLSSLWKVPVSGALTGSHFEILMPNGQFEMASEVHKQGSTTTRGLLEKEKSCVRFGTVSGCYRMRPENTLYDGKYGKFRQTLPIYKFFCVGLSEDVCLKGMARSMMSAVTATAVEKDLRAESARESFARAAREWLCPVGNARTRQTCFNKLVEIDQAMLSSKQPTEIERLYTPMSRAGSAQCTFTGCYEKSQCMTAHLKTWECAKTEAPPARSTTFVDEYMNYMKGFALLQAEQTAVRVSTNP